MIFEALVMSIPKAKLILTDIPDSYWKKIETFKGTAARNIIGVHERASIRPALADLAWSTTETDVKVAKLLFAGRLFRENKALHTNKLVQVRRRHIENGDRRGFFGQIYKILTEWHVQELWEQGPTMPETEWKKRVKNTAANMTKLEWDEWANATGNEHYKGKPWGLEPYVEALTKKKRSRIGALRMKTTNARADKIINDQTTNCRICLKKVPETSAHLVAECPTLDTERSQYLATSGKQKPAKLREILEDIENNCTFLDEVQDTFFFFTEEQLIPFIPSQVAFTPESVILELEKTAKWIAEPERET